MAAPRKNSGQESVLNPVNIVKLGSILGAGAIFFLFYAVLGNPFWLALVASLLALAGLWLMAIDPLQRKLINAATARNDLEATNKMLLEARAKVDELRKSGAAVSSSGAKGSITGICLSLDHAIQIIQDPARMDRSSARQLLTINLDSTVEFVDHYSKIAARKNLDSQETATLQKAEAFLAKLNSRYAAAIDEMGARDLASSSAALETQMEMLNLLFSGVDDDNLVHQSPADHQESNSPAPTAGRRQVSIESDRGKL